MHDPLDTMAGDTTDWESNPLGGVTSAEHALLGTTLHHPEILDDLDLSDQDFANIGLGRLYRLLLDMRAEGENIDPVTVAIRIPALAAEGFRGLHAVHVHELYSDAPLGTGLAPTHARIVREQAIRRRLLESASRLAQMARSGADVAEIVENARADIDSSSRAVVREWSMDEAFGEFLAQIGTPQPMFPTMWTGLNDVIGGYRPGELYVVGARPGVGKSIFGIQAMIDLAAHGQVVMHSLEMPTRQVLTRLAANVARVDTRRLDGSGGQLRDVDRMMLDQHAAELRSLPVSIDDRAAVTVNQIRSHVRTVARRGKVAGLIVDYLGLIAGSRASMTTYERVSENVRLLKAIAKEFDIPVILQAQLNRKVEERGSAMPAMSDLRDSGEIEQHAGVIMFLYDGEEEGYGMYVPKNRHGRSNINIPLVRRGEFSRLENATFGQPYGVEQA